MLRYGTPEEVGMSPKRVERLKGLCSGWVEAGLTPAMATLVARRGVIVNYEGYGRLGPGADAAPTMPDTIFSIASLTKNITSTAIMLLVEDGLLGLNRPVQAYVPGFEGDGKDAVLVHHLLTHTSGLREEDVNQHVSEGRIDGVRLPPCPEGQSPQVHEYLQARLSTPLWKSPGEEMSYCNFGYAILGEIVRRVSGQQLLDFARARILDPLGLKDTDSYDGVDQSRRDQWPRQSRPAFQMLRGLVLGFGGLWSTTLDMAVLGQMFLNGGQYGGARVLSRPAAAEMTRNQIPGIPTNFLGEYHKEASYGYGWAIRGQEQWRNFYWNLTSPQTFWHTGALETLLWVDPVEEIVGALFAHRLNYLDVLPFDLFVNAAMAAVED